MSDPTEAEWLEGNDPMTERERKEDAMTNQFTDEQVEAAAKAYWLASEREIHDKPITWEWDKEERRRYMWAARQVLAGVAPQAASVPGQLTRKFDGGRGAMLNEAGSIVGYYTPPVQPSSTVDEVPAEEIARNGRG